MKTPHIHIERRITKTESELFCQRSVEFKQLPPDDACLINHGIRVYGGNQCAVLQLRAIGPITEDSRKGKPRRMIATANYLDRKEVRALIDRLTEIEGTLQSK